MRRDYWHYAALAAILLVAAAFRFFGLDWDRGYLFHPDERKILLVASDIHLPASIPEFLSPDSPLNPKFFAYGSFPIYLLKALSVFSPAAADAVPWRDTNLVGLALLGRALSGVFDLGTIALTFLLARRLFSASVGLVAAACIAVTVLHIQLSHFYAVDTLLAFFVVATIFFAARFADTGTRGDALMMAITFGLAMATKISAAPLVVPMAVAVVKATYHEDATTQRKQDNRLRTFVSVWLIPVWRVRRTLAQILGVALAIFVVTQPYALLDAIRYFGQVGTESLVARGWLDFPYTRQFADTLPFFYQIWQSGVWGFSLPLGIFAW
ncbi:MAG TPA: glycosyltransferase family 39 protein, partial [Anaerolineae bacterium]